MGSILRKITGISFTVYGTLRVPRGYTRVIPGKRPSGCFENRRDGDAPLLRITIAKLRGYLSNTVFPAFSFLIDLSYQPHVRAYGYICEQQL